MPLDWAQRRLFTDSKFGTHNLSDNPPGYPTWRSSSLSPHVRQFRAQLPVAQISRREVYSRTCLIARLSDCTSCKIACILLPPNWVFHTFTCFLLARLVILHGYCFHGHRAIKQVRL